MIKNIKNVSVDECNFTIKKECDRCKNILYFSEAAIDNMEINENGSVIFASIVCPICGKRIELYSNKPASGSPVFDIKTVRLEDDF
ncbi:hypothetical protein CUJ83_12065 [Methanocella sp. CWC-04]|uniref:Uncharacterized protein n=1 Tax=Methanooceanicella nereidis TaxID=2052831 RepID=A0AAP2RE76_9EURY|nr:hypothetical protein [Methanocella sp. CWC-04]MCD1295734.1 hypothetical protein [Methanocella sp. CWC-04]